MRQTWTLIAVCVLALVGAGGAAHAADATFADWAAVVVSGDWHAHDGSPSNAFDNARRDVAAELLRIGFAPQNVMQFSADPELHSNESLLLANPQTVSDGLWDLSNQTKAGCLVYLTSHGSPDGIGLSDDVLAPKNLAAMIDNSCAERPTVIFISSCYSGVFVPALQGPDRFVMTAAEADRSSFGCGTGDKYPYFDACFLKALPLSHDFPGLADSIKACVTQEEKATGAAPPSDPQESVGADIVAKLPHW